MTKTINIKRIDFPQNDSPAQFSQYVLELKDVFIGKDGIVLDSNRNPMPDAMQSAYYSIGRNADKVNMAIKRAKESTAITDLLPDIDYIHCLHHVNKYRYGHLLDNIQPLKKIEGLDLDGAILLIHEPSDLVFEQDRHFQKFGYDKEHQKILSFGRGSDNTLYKVPKLWYSSMLAPEACWVQSAAEWVRQKYGPFPDAKPTKIYISRKDVSRRVLNEEEVRRFLTERGFTVFEGNEGLDKTIELFSGAQVIVGAHGGGFTNSLFSLGDPLIIEFCPDKRMNKCFLHNSTVIGHSKHRLITAKCDDSYNINIDISHLESLI